MDKEGTLTIIVQDPDQVLTAFDVILVERSTASEVGPFTQLTEDVAEAATLLGTGLGPFTVSGKILQIIVDEGVQTDIQFTGSDPLTADNVKNQINTALGGLIAANETEKVRLTSTITGTDSKLEIVGGSAISELGFTAGQRDIGADAHIPVVSGTQTYIYVDEDGMAGFWYRTAYKKLTSGVQSQFGTVFQLRPASPLDPANLITCTIDLVDLSGTAKVGTKISFYPVSLPLVVDDVGIDFAREGITVTTDAAGHAEVTLVKGSRVKVVFEGTSFIRTIDIPDAASCDLLDAISVVDDQFTTAVVPNLPAAPRRTL